MPPQASVTVGRLIALPCLPPGTEGCSLVWVMLTPSWMPGSSLEPLQQAGALLRPGVWSFLSFPRHKLADQRTRKSLGRGEFRLLHYAGEVTYSVTGEDSGVGSLQWPGEGLSLTSCLFPLSGFLDKNNDLLFRNLKEVRKTGERDRGLDTDWPLLQQSVLRFPVP